MEESLWSPWRHLREHHPDVEVFETDELPKGLMGCVDYDARIVWLTTGLTQAERRCTIAHEIGHLERGPGSCDPHGMELEERVIDEWASRLLIPTCALVRAFQWSPHLPEIAEELWVDLHMLRARIRAMTDEEQDAVMDAIAKLWSVA